jgi:hypothetical protein
VDKFKELFQVKIDPTEMLKEYYSLQQQAVIDEAVRWNNALPPSSMVEVSRCGLQQREVSNAGF